MHTRKSVEPRIFKGTRDFLPDEMVQRERIISTIKSIFRRYGFLPMETPSIEFMEILTGKYGEEGDKLIYPLAYKGGNELALRYDLTVPLSRVIAMYPELPRPFKRYQIQPVWRADRPQLVRGRYREFYQCDVDTIGSASLVVDAEIIALARDVLDALGFRNFVIRINSRKILAGIIDMAGLAAGMEDTICRSLDKLEKIGRDGVEEELGGKGLEASSIRTLWDILDVHGAPEEIIVLLGSNPRITPRMKDALSEMESLLRYLASFGLTDEVFRWDLFLARGLDYYTGPIFESVLPEHPHIGSLTGGGRYDNLIGTFLGSDVPAVGTTIGLDRIFAAMEQLKMLEGSASGIEVMVSRFDDGATAENIKVAQLLRNAGFAVELYPETDKLKKQFGFADKKNIPVVIVQGPDEIAKGTVTVKNLSKGAQEEIAFDNLVNRLREIIRPA